MHHNILTHSPQIAQNSEGVFDDRLTRWPGFVPPSTHSDCGWCGIAASHPAPACRRRGNQCHSWVRSLGSWCLVPAAVSSSPQSSWSADGLAAMLADQAQSILEAEALFYLYVLTYIIFYLYYYFINLIIVSLNFNYFYLIIIVFISIYLLILLIYVFTYNLSHNIYYIRT